MRATWVIASAVFAGAQPALASDFILNIVAGAGQESSFDHGTELIDDPQPKSVVRFVEPRDATDKHGAFMMLVLNRGNVPVNFGPENVKIRLPDGTSVAMLDYNELMRREKKHEKWQRIAMALAAGGRGASANGYSSGTVNYSGQSNGTYGATPYSAQTTGTATYSGYNAAAASVAQSQANEQTRRDVEAMQAHQQEARSQISAVMQTTTTQPGGVTGGGLQFDMPKGVKATKVAVPIIIEVTVGAETHQFHGTLTKK